MPRNNMTPDINPQRETAPPDMGPRQGAYAEEAMAGGGPNPNPGGDAVAQAIQQNAGMLNPQERAMLVDLINPQTLPALAKLLGPAAGEILAPLASTSADQAMSAAGPGMEPGAPSAQMPMPGPPGGGMGGGPMPPPPGGAGGMPPMPGPAAAGPGGGLANVRSM